MIGLFTRNPVLSAMRQNEYDPHWHHYKARRFTLNRKMPEEIHRPATRKFLQFFCLLFIIGATPAYAATAPLNIVMFGDSLTAGYLLPPGHAIPDMLDRALAEKNGPAVRIMNAGVSGDTTTGGLSRLDWAIGPDTDGVILELGANDGLRGIDPDLTKKNLAAIIHTLQQRGIPVLLAGMVAPPNLGSDYGNQFDAVFPALAKEYGLRYIPFFMTGVLPDNNQNLTIDGMHPNDQGVAIVVNHLLPSVELFITDVQKARHARASGEK